MSLEIVPSGAIASAEWDHLADNSPESWLWHRWGFQRALATWPGRVDASFGVANGGGELLAITPLHVVRRRVVPGLPLARLDSHGGPACRGDLSDRQSRRVRRAVVEQLLTTAADVRAMDIRIQQPALAPCRWPDSEVVSPLVTLGFVERSVATWVHDLRHGGLPQAWEQLQSATQSSIEAHRAELEIRTADGRSGLADYYDLHVATFERTGATPHPRAYFEMIWDELVRLGLAIPLIAYHGVDAVAAVVVGHHRRRAQYWMGASSARGQELHANDILQWSVIERLVADGVEVYELGPAYFGAHDAKLSGISFFKSKFASGLAREPRAFWDTASPVQGLARMLHLTAFGDAESGVSAWTDRGFGQRFSAPW